MQELSDSELMEFKLGAASFYKKAGVDPVKAEELFNKHLAKVAGQFGFKAEVKPEVKKEVSPKIQKLASILKKSVSKNETKK